ncbi:MAG: carbohydrate-binding family 9-like protein [Acidobacteriaceae bacterium]
MKTLVVLSVLLATSLAIGQPAKSPVFNSVRASHDVALDTNPKSAFWQGAEPAYIGSDNRTGKAVAEKAEVRSRWTEKNLYLLFICPYHVLSLKPNPDTKSETFQLWNWDVAELFIGYDFKNIRRYKEFEISPQGEWIDLDIDAGNPHHENGWKWNSGYQVSARIDRKKKIWYGAMRIPMRSIYPHPATVGTIFRANMFRTEGPLPADEYAWSPSMNNTFHIPERFGLLKLVDHK